MENFRLYTQDINRDFIQSLLDNHFDSYSLFTGFGIWHGAEELSLCVEVISDGMDDTMSKLESIAAAIKRGNNQEAVLVTRHLINSQLL